MRNDEVCCPFCGKREDEVAQMIDRAHAFICDHCIDICHEPSAKSASGARRPDPSARGSADRKNSAKQPCGRTVLCHRGFEQVIGYLQSAICNTKVGVEKGELLGQRHSGYRHIGKEDLGSGRGAYSTDVKGAPRATKARTRGWPLNSL
jgi:hypothetical protein